MLSYKLLLIYFLLFYFSEHWEIVGEEARSLHKWSYHVLTHEGMMGQVLFGSNVNLGKIEVHNDDNSRHYKINGDYTTASFRGLIVGKNLILKQRQTHI